MPEPEPEPEPRCAAYWRSPIPGMLSPLYGKLALRILGGLAHFRRKPTELAIRTSAPAHRRLSLPSATQEAVHHAPCSLRSCKAPAYSSGPCRGSADSGEHRGGSSLLAGSKARGGGLSPMGSEPATWCGLVGGLTERERGTVCAGRASALLRGVGCGGPFSATRAVYGTQQTHVFHERVI